MDTQQAELERTRNEASLLRADRGEAQKIMDTQHREVEQLRQSFAALQKDREEAQKIMDVQQAEMERLRSDFSLLLEDREKAQKIMDTQRVLFCKQGISAQFVFYTAKKPFPAILPAKPIHRFKGLTFIAFLYIQ